MNLFYYVWLFTTSYRQLQYYSHTLGVYIYSLGSVIDHPRGPEKTPVNYANDQLQTLSIIDHWSIKSNWPPVNYVYLGTGQLSLMTTGQLSLFNHWPIRYNWRMAN